VDNEPSFDNAYFVYENDNISESENVKTIDLPAGIYYWRVRAIDGVGLEGAWSENFKLNISYVLILISPPDGAALDNQTVEFRWENTWPVDNFRIQVDNDPDFTFPAIDNENVLENRYTATLSEGQWFWRVNATSGGSTSDWSENWTFYVDLTAPSITLTEKPSDPTTETTQTFEGTASDTLTWVVGIEYRVNGGSWSSVSITPGPSVSFSFTTTLGEGTYTVDIRATDNAGNQGILSYTFTVSIPAPPPPPPPPPQPPVSQVLSITPYWRASLPFTIDAEATDNDGVVVEVALYYRFSPDNENWSEWKLFEVDSEAPWSWSFTALENDGYYEFYSLATDDGNNVESAPENADASCGIDTAPPTATFVINENALITYSRMVTLAIEAFDELSGAIEMQFSEDLENWTEWEPLATQRTYTLSPTDGVKHVYVRVRDRAGNFVTAWDSIELRTEVGLMPVPPTQAGENVALPFSIFEEMNVSEVQLILAKDIPEGWVRIKEFREPPENVVPPPARVYIYFIMTTDIEHEDIDVLRIRFRVSRDWILPGEENQLCLFWENLVDKSWKRLPTALLKKDIDYFYFLAIAPSPATFAIGIPEVVAPPLVAPPMLPLLLLVIVGAALGAFGTFQAVRWLRRRAEVPAPVRLARPIKKVKPKRPPPIIEFYRDMLAPAAEELKKKREEEESGKATQSSSPQSSS
jgi:PGF-pre-PGF domain-containing protein